MGVRWTGEALERRAILVRKDIVEEGGITIIYCLDLDAVGRIIRQVSLSGEMHTLCGKTQRH